MSINSINFKDQISKILEIVTGIKSPNVEFAANSDFGDYSSNIALKDKNVDIDELVAKFNQNKSNFKAEKLGRFINFWLKNDVLVDNLIHIDSQKEDYGKNNIGKNKLVIVEYSSPNIAKPFGVGHLRSTVIGDAIANLMVFNGYKVMRDNHLGDWGTQFGKVICAIKRWGSEEEIERSEDPVKELVDLYVKYHEESKNDPKLDDEARGWFKKLEEGDTETKRLWQKCVDWSWVEFEKIYDLLGIKFDSNFNTGRGLGESFFESRMSGVIKELEEAKLLKEGEDGAKLVFFNNDKYPPLMILKKDGTTLYSTRDLATDKYRFEKYNPELVINEVGSEQSLYFKQLYEIEKILGWYKEGQRVHVGHGLFLMDGKKMSTRAGKTVKLDEVLVEAIERAEKIGLSRYEHEWGKDYVVSKKKDKRGPILKFADQLNIAEKVGIGAIKYFDLSHHPLTNINFDWESMFAMDGNSSPYIQYTIARINSLLGKSGIKNVEDKSNFKDIKFADEELLLMRKLSQFDEIIVTATKNYSPNIICNYLYELSSKFNTFYNKHKIVESDEEEFRILLSKGTAQVLKNGLKLLGIESPNKM